MFAVSNIEEILAYNCAPCFAGIKPSNLVSVSMEEFKQISSINLEFLKGKGFFIKVLCKCSKRVQLFLYHKESLSNFITQPEVVNALKIFGYSQNSSIEELLDILASRMDISQNSAICKKNSNFPHEIGLFLGYPAEDVIAYYRKKGKDCIFSGYWKVYSNAEKAAEIFSKYTECKKQFALQIQNGFRLYDLLSA